VWLRAQRPQGASTERWAGRWGTRRVVVATKNRGVPGSAQGVRHAVQADTRILGAMLVPVGGDELAVVPAEPGARGCHDRAGRVGDCLLGEMLAWRQPIGRVDGRRCRDGQYFW